jgi:hypothetical protein
MLVMFLMVLFCFPTLSTFWHAVSTSFDTYIFFEHNYFSGTTCGKGGNFGLLGNGNTKFSNITILSTVVVKFKATICVSSESVENTVANLLGIQKSQITQISTSCSISNTGNTTTISFYLSGNSNTMANSYATNLNNILIAGVNALPIVGNLTVSPVPNVGIPIPLSTGGIIGIFFFSKIKHSIYNNYFRYNSSSIYIVYVSGFCGNWWSFRTT